MVFVSRDVLGQLCCLLLFTRVCAWVTREPFSLPLQYRPCVNKFYITNRPREAILHDYIYSVPVAPYPTKAIYSDIDHRLCFIRQQNQFLSAKDFFLPGEPWCWLSLIWVYSSYCLLFLLFLLNCNALPSLSRLLWGFIENSPPKSISISKYNCFPSKPVECLSWLALTGHCLGDFGRALHHKCY